MKADVSNFCQKYLTKNKSNSMAQLSSLPADRSIIDCGRAATVREFEEDFAFYADQMPIASRKAKGPILIFAFFECSSHLI